MAYMVNIINLHKGQIYHLSSHGSRGRLRILEGTAWITLAGHNEDFVLKAGDEFPAVGDLLLESLSARVSFHVQRETPFLMESAG